MRVVVRIHEFSSNLFRASNEVDEKENFLTNLRNQTVLETINSRKLQQSIYELPEVDKYLVSDAVNKGICISQSRFQSTFDLELTKEVNLSSFLASPAFKDVFIKRDSPIFEDESAQSVILRKLSHLFSVAKKLTFVDAFFLDNLLQFKNNGTKLFLTEAFKCQIPEIEIISMHQDYFKRKTRSSAYSINPDFDVVKESAALEQALRSLKSNQKSESLVSVKVLKLNRSTFPHDRYGEIRFDAGRLGFNMGKGAETLFSTKAQGARIIQASSGNLRIQQLSEVPALFTASA